MFYTYLIENKINGKLYVGKSSNVENRWMEHKRVALGGKKKHPQKYQILHRAISKYGFKNFTIKILKICETEQQSFIDEVKFIEKFKLAGYQLYNLTNGGEGTSGYKASKKAKNQRSLMMTGKNHFFYGKKHTKETKEKMSQSRINNTNSLGYKHTNKTKLKMSISKKGKPSNMIGKTHSEKTKQKMSEVKAGDKNQSAKLSWEEVSEIRKLYLNGIKYKDLADQFNIHPSSVSNICRYKTWKI